MIDAVMAHVYLGISSFSIASIVELVIFLCILSSFSIASIVELVTGIFLCILSSFSIAFIVELVIFLCIYLILLCLPAWGELSY